MGDFARRKVDSAGFVGYRFSRVRRKATAGFAFGFALRPGALPGVAEPPEAVAFAFVEPADSALYEELVLRRSSPVRRLAAATRDLGFPFEFRPGETTAAVRRRSLARVPPELFVLEASDFFMVSQNPLRQEGFLNRVVRATDRRGP